VTSVQGFCDGSAEPHCVRLQNHIHGATPGACPHARLAAQWVT